MQDPDDRRRHGRRRRRVDRLAVARGHAEGRAAVGGRRPRARSATARAAPRSTITDAHVVLGRIPPHLLGGEIPLDVDAARAGVEALAGKLGLTPEACATGVLEISAWNQANALRQITVKRGLDVRDFTLTTFGGSGSLLLCRLIDILGIPRVLVPPDPGNVSAFGLLTVDVKNDYVRTHVTLARPLDAGGVAGGARRAHRRGARRRWPRRASPRSSTSSRAPPTCATSARRSRCGCQCPRGTSTRARSPRSPTSSTPSTERSTATTSAATRPSRWSGSTCGSPGIGPITRPEIRALDDARPGRSRQADSGDADPLLRRGRRLRRHAGPLACRPRGRARSSTGPAILEEFGSTVPLHPGFTARSTTTST